LRGKAPDIFISSQADGLMPELPEVETTCRGLMQRLQGAKILRVEQHCPSLRWPLPPRLPERLTGQTLGAMRRRAKYIIIELSGGEALVLHLGMSGRLVVGTAAQAREKHDHIVLHCSGGRVLRFNDPRRFGMLDLCPSAHVPEHALLKNLGIEPLESGLTAAYLAEKFRGKTTSLKAALLDQRIIAGLGNIYVSEALFHARLSPERLAGSLRRKECAALVPAIQTVLQAAITAGGSSLRDYVQSNGALGFFQNQFAVYDRAGQRCPDCRCNGGVIQRLVQSGRATFFCPHRQK
jgi:formamidopyrimidine-DNA glycosylase